LAEWLAPQVWREEGLHPMRPAVKEFFKGHGLSDDAIAKMDASREATPFRNFPLPARFRRLRDNENITFGQRQWKVLVNGGHADEHASFYCKSDGILIAGDQILSKISPVVGVFPSQPKADPLTDYLASLDRLRKLPAETIVLPSHGLPFRGLHARIDQLKAHHASRLQTLWDLIATPKDGIELAHGLFPKAMAAGGQVTMALAETLAHAHHLMATKRAMCERAVGEPFKFRRLPTR
jgi:glyoxylase-like metal-dependent hydrolase (beta-lactamase superfamily II)